MFYFFWAGSIDGNDVEMLHILWAGSVSDVDTMIRS
jgi:hypothetical protein